MRMTRKQFLKTGFAAASTLWLSSRKGLLASPMNQPIGFQTYELIAHLTDDWQGTWNKMAGYGYKFADLVQFKTVPALSHYTAKDILQALRTADLGCTNYHFTYTQWTQSYSQTLDDAHTVGVKSVVCSLGPRRSTVDDWKWMAEQLNELGAKVRKDGLQLAYHNHEIEFRPVEGQIPWDILIANTEPQLVTYQIDVGNLTFGGGDPVYYLRKYPGRYFGMHLKDFKPGQASVPVGQGILHWNEIFAIAKQQNIRSYVTEVGAYGVATLDGQPLEQSKMDVMESFRQSFVFVNNYKDPS
jgi:sugar phosphate isomerase/epimerase